ncbi:MAG TPA: hypothetical protein VGF07_13265 [Stellaceae bacterium]|jgi:hypothetical protein
MSGSEPIGGGGEVVAGPGYWMHETSGVLRPVVEVYLAGKPLSPHQIAILRAYLRQWIMAPIWDCNPYASNEDRVRLAELRAVFHRGRLTSREAIAGWLADALDEGIDPL